MLINSDLPGGVSPAEAGDFPDPEVAPRAKARSFAASYKKRILAELDELDSEEQAALLRREGLYSALIRKWRMQAARDAGGANLAPSRPGPKADPTARELTKARREVERLNAELATSRRINDVQAKLCALLDDLSKGATTTSKPTT